MHNRIGTKIKLFFFAIQAIKRPKRQEDKRCGFRKGDSTSNWILQITPKTKQIRGGVRVRFGNLTP